MLRLLLCIFIAFPTQYVSGVNSLCDSSSEKRKTLSCTTQILGRKEEHDICKMEVYPPNSQACNTMAFGPLMTNTKIGGVTLKPYIMTMVHEKTITPYAINHTVLNITFSNIKWNSMRFRFQDKYRDLSNHCRHINISNNAPIDDRSVLYYDCYWTKTDDKDGQSHILDFEAYGDGVVNRGQYYFNVPTAEMLSPVAKEEEWKPFIYIEIFPSTMRLHILPPPAPLKINAYKIDVMKECRKGSCEIESKTMNVINRTDDVMYDYKFLMENGLYYFSVTPLHKKCSMQCDNEECTEQERCNIVESPKIKISSESQTMNICIASVTALIVATLFAYYVALRLIRRYWCKDYYKRAASEIPQPTKVLVIYSPANRLHAECVLSFVNYLRTEYGFDILYDGDISITSHNDPYIWAEEAFRLASHVMYIVGPKEENNQYSIYDKPILTAHKDVDLLLLSFVKASRVSRKPKEILNVFFEHSDGEIPIETRHDKVFFLLKDWQKLISYLSKNLLPRRQIMRTEKGRCFLEDLTRAKKMLSIKPDEVVVKCDKLNVSDKKILL